MASKADAWMPLYVADYLRDTTHLTRDQHGGYMLLLMACWNSGGRLPNDPGQLAAIAKATPAEWRRMAPILLRFFQVDGEEIVHGRVVSEHQKAARLSEIRRQNGGKGGRPKKQSETGEKATGKATGKAKPKLTETPSPSPVGKEADASTPNSVPNGTGGAPLSNDPPDDLAEIRALEPKAAAWALSRKVLCERGGLTRAKAGEVVGKLFRDHSLTSGELWEAAEATWRAGTEAPVPYLTKLCVTAAAKRGGADLLEPSERQQIAWMEDWVESPANWRGTRGPRPGEPGCRVRQDIQDRFGVRPVVANDPDPNEAAA